MEETARVRVPCGNSVGNFWEVWECFGDYREEAGDVHDEGNHQRKSSATDHLVERGDTVLRERCMLTSSHLDLPQ